MDPRKLRRPIRFVLVAAMVVMVALYWRDRPQTFTMGTDDTSLLPYYPPGTKLLVQEIDAAHALERDAFVLYSVDGHAHFGRVRGLAGDEIGSQGGTITVNGAPISPLPIPGEAMGAVPEGQVLILANNPRETRYPDSRRFGFIPREDVRAIIVGKAK